MTIKPVLLTITFGLLIWLLIDSFFQLDIAATKNNGLTNTEKGKVDEMQNIDSLKVYSKSNLDVIRQNIRNTSSLATKRIWQIFVLIIIQVFLLIYKKRRSIS